MKTTDSVMREKKLGSIHDLLNVKIQELLIYYGVHDILDADLTAELATRIEDLLSHSLAEARREWVEEMRGKVNDMKYRGIAHSDLEARRHNALLEKIEDLLTGDNPEEAKV